MRIKVSELKKLVNEEVQRLMKTESFFRRTSVNKQISFEWSIDVPVGPDQWGEKVVIVHAYVEPYSPGDYNEPPSGGNAEIERITDEHGKDISFEELLRLENQARPISAKQLMDELEEKALEIGPDYSGPDDDY